ncbi:MAG TPA: RNA polymerase sigma factor [Vicinamibacterales bacterium]|nr:RNA polymerase sigma factor [Vicinamibacterales bacterium]
MEPTALTSSVTDELSDEAIVERVRAGDAALYEILVRRHNQRLYRAVRAILRHDEQVEDVMQQAYVDAYRHLDQFRGAAKFSTWLTRIAVNRAIRSGRGKRRGLALVMPQSDLPNAIERAPDPGLDPEEAMYGHELKAILESLIDQLPEPFRVVFVLREVEGLSTADTAACLSLNEDTVKTRLHRAKRLLRERLDRNLGPAAGSVYQFHLTRCDRVVAGVMSALRCSLPDAAHPERLRHPAGGDRRDA